MNVEFVSANPTGPVHVGNGWFASYGDALGRVLERCGYDVTREYYVNDTGGQIRAPRRQRAGPVEGRAACPRTATAARFVKGLASAYDGPDDVDRRPAGGRPSTSLGFIRRQMEAVHIDYDEWFSQASIEDSEARRRDRRAARATRAWCSRRTAPCGCAPPTSATARGAGDPQGRRRPHLPAPATSPTTATSSWSAASTASSTCGAPTTTARWPACMAGVEALGVERDRLEVRLGQMISLDAAARHVEAGRQRGRPRRPRRRDRPRRRCGSCRCCSSIDQAPTIDLDRCAAESKEKPVFYVQYAHARIALDRPGGGRGAASSARPLDDGRPRRCSCTSASSTCCARSPSCPTSCALALHRPGAAQGHHVGARAGRPVPRLLPRLLRDR